MPEELNHIVWQKDKLKPKAKIYLIDWADADLCQVGPTAILVNGLRLIMMRRLQRQLVHLNLHWYGIVTGEASQTKNILGQSHSFN